MPLASLLRERVDVMTVVTEFETMNQNAEEETRLWSAYLMAVNNRDRLEYLHAEAWRNHVRARSSETRQFWHEAMDRGDKAREQAKQARVAWKRVAYPLHGWHLDEDELSS